MGFLPESKKQGDIKFIFSKNLNYLNRMWLVVICFSAGILMQLFLNFWLGLLALIVGTGLSLINGYSANPELARESEQWNQVTPDEYSKIKLRQSQLKKWDIDVFDITNPFGTTVLLALGIFCFVVWFMLAERGESQLSLFWAIDCIVVFLPHWVTGVRTFLKRDKLIIKINLLERIISELSSPSDVQVLPMLSTREAKQGGRVPMDARLMVKFLNAPSDFLGMQVQVSINSVEGKDYPYLYSVVLAKPEFGLFKRLRTIPTAKALDLKLEEENSSGVDVLVMRQHTTMQSGYYTNLKRCVYIVNAALNLGRQLISAA